MNSRRLIILIVAVVVGVLASASVYTYVNNVKTEASRDSETTSVWVVVETIPRGTPADVVLANDFLAQVEVDVNAKPATAIDDPASQIQGLVAVFDIPADVQIVEGLFVEPGVVDTGITDRLEERGLVTVTFQVDQVSGAASMIEPGDRVNIMVLSDRLVGDEGVAAALEEGEALVAPDPTAEAKPDDDEVEVDPFVVAYPKSGRYVYQYVEILAMGTTLTNDLGAQESEEEAAAAVGGSGLVTVAVPPEAVPVLLGIDMSNIYLSLVPQNYVPIPGLGVLDLGEDPEVPTYPGERDGELTPYPDLNESFVGVSPSKGSESEDENQ